MNCFTDGLEDPLGFTNQTAALLTGLGCSNLSNFKKKNISIDDLKYLTEEDLSKLVDEVDTFDFKSFKRLTDNLKKKDDGEYKQNFQDVLEILKYTKQQLQVLNVYYSYIYKEYLSSHSDFFLEPNKNLKASTANIIASTSVLEEIEYFEETLRKMQTNKKKCNNNHLKYGVLIGGMCVIVLIYAFR